MELRWLQPSTRLLNESGKLMGEKAKHKGAPYFVGTYRNMQRRTFRGRGFESFSEDPYLAGMVSAIVNGVQSEHVAGHHQTLCW